MCDTPPAVQDIGNQISSSVSNIGQTLQDPMAAKPSDVFTAVGDPLGGSITHAVDTNKTLAPINEAVGSYFSGGLGAAPLAAGIQKENAMSGTAQPDSNAMLAGALIGSGASMFGGGGGAPTDAGAPAPTATDPSTIPAGNAAGTGGLSAMGTDPTMGNMVGQQVSSDLASGAAPVGTDAGAVSTATSAAPSTPGFIDKALSAGGSALSGAGKALPWVSLAANVNAMKQSQSAAQQLQANAGSSGQVGQHLLSNFQSGQLSGSDQQAIAQYQTQQTSAINDYYAKAGLSNSSMHTQALQQVQQQAESMRQQALQNMLTQGLSATGTTNSALSAAANANIASSKDTSQALSDFMTALSKMNAQPGAGA
jgi:hypothetical protein